MATAVTDTPVRPALDPKQHLMQLTSAFQLSACLWVAAKLGVADLLAAGPRPVAELAKETETDSDALYRVLRALVSVGVFAEPKPRTLALSPAAELLRSDVPGSLRGQVLWVANPFLTRVTADLLHSVKTGQPAVEHVYGKPVFECLATMPEVAYDFNSGMTAMSAELAPAVLDAYDFSGVNTLMDVAGGHGYFLCQALQRHPRMKGILLDLPHVVEGAKCTVCDLRLEERCQPVAGDIFAHIPAGADAYFMQHILHDWTDERCLKILGNIRQALAGRPDGRLVVVDMVLPQDSQPHPGKLLDLVMLMFPGGRERTEPEWHDLLAQAGFKLTRITPTRVADSVIEAVVA